MREVIKIISGDDIAHRDGLPDHRAWIKHMASRFNLRLVEKVSRVKTIPFIDFGRWCVPCPYCNGSEYGEPNDPVFYCLSCGNADIGGKLIKVDFPSKADIKTIETLLMERPVAGGYGQHIAQIAMSSKPTTPGLNRCFRCAHSGCIKAHSLDELMAQNVEYGLSKAIH